MLSTPQDVRAFEQIILPWMAAYRFADCAALALKANEGSPLLFGRIVLLFSRPEYEASFQLDTEFLRARRRVLSLPQGQVKTFIGAVSSGTVHIDEEEFSLKPEGQYLGSFLLPLHHPEVESRIRLPTLRFFGMQKEPLLQSRSYQSVEHLDWSLKALDQPFDSLDELLHSIGLPGIQQIGERTTLEIVAANPASILDTSRVQQNQALIHIRMAHELDRSKIKLGYKVQRGTVLHRSVARGDSFEWKPMGHYQDGLATVDVGEASVLQTFLSYQEIAVHQWWVLDPDKIPNIRQAVYELFDPQSVILKTFVTGQGRQTARDFEIGIAFLANLLGFAIVPFSIVPQLTDGPDLIASTPSGNVAIIECTTGHLTENNKLAKLIRRTNSLKERLRSTGQSHVRVHPVIVSLLSELDVQAELEEARKHNVAVMCKEQLDALMTREILSPNAEELYKRLPQLIPQPKPVQSQESLFPPSPLSNLTSPNDSRSNEM